MAGANNSRAASRVRAVIVASVGVSGRDARTRPTVAMTNGRVRFGSAWRAALNSPIRFATGPFPMRKLLIVLSAASAMASASWACDDTPAAEATGASPEATADAEAAATANHNEYSSAEPDKVKTTELALDLAVDFERKTISGTATYTLDWLDPDATQLLLDTREIGRASCSGGGQTRRR